MTNVFSNATKTLPKQDKQIVRIDFEQSQIAGRKDHLPKEMKSDVMPIKHTESMG